MFLYSEPRGNQSWSWKKTRPPVRIDTKTFFVSRTQYPRLPGGDPKWGWGRNPGEIGRGVGKKRARRFGSTLRHFSFPGCKRHGFRLLNFAKMHRFCASCQEVICRGLYGLCWGRRQYLFFRESSKLGRRVQSATNGTWQLKNTKMLLVSTK